MQRTLILALVPVLAVGCSSGGKSTAGVAASTVGEPAAQTVTVGMTDQLTFEPDTINARVGTVTFDVSNLGRVPHNLVFDEQRLGGTDTVDGNKAEPLKVVFGKAGTFTFVCTFHARMTGKVVVSVVVP